MKTKKIIVEIVTIIGIIAIGVLLINQRHLVANRPYKETIESIDNKGTLNVLIVDKNENTGIKDIFNYYKEVYEVNYKLINKDPKNEEYKETIKKIDPNLTGEEPFVFAVIKDGVAIATLMGDLEEKNLKDFLINNEIIDKNYKNIDTAIDNKYKDYLNDKRGYCILYINAGDKDLYKYRRQLVENRIRSLIMYVGNGNQNSSEKYFKEKIGIKKGDYSKLPMTIKIRNGKILNTSSDVKVSELVRKCR